MADQLIRLSDALAVVQGVREEVRNCESLGGPLNAYEALTLTRTSLSTIMPADARPVLRGHWVRVDWWSTVVTYRCSECKFYAHTKASNFCPNCGADMRDNETAIS